MKTRKHFHEEQFNVGPDEMFRILHTPTAICKWWGASRAIVLAEENGFWAAAWGENEDEPDYATAFVIKAFEPPKRIVLGEAKYCTNESKLPFEAKMTSEFVIEPNEAGCLLRVTQDGFPCDPIADDFYSACDVGWRNTFQAISDYFETEAKK